MSARNYRYEERGTTESQRVRCMPLLLRDGEVGECSRTGSCEIGKERFPCPQHLPVSRYYFTAPFPFCQDGIRNKWACHTTHGAGGLGRQGDLSGPP